MRQIKIFILTLIFLLLALFSLYVYVFIYVRINPLDISALQIHIAKKVLSKQIREYDVYTNDSLLDKLATQTDWVDQKAIINNLIPDLADKPHIIPFLKAKACIRTDNYNCAEEQIEETLLLKDNFYPALSLKGLIYATDIYNRPKEALSLVEKALAFNPYSAYVRYQYGLILYANDNIADGNKQLKIAAALSDESHIYIAQNAIDKLFTNDNRVHTPQKTKDDRSDHAGSACHDADIVNIQPNKLGQIQYEAPKDQVIQSVCYRVTRDDELFPISQHQIKKDNGKEFCNEVKGIGTNTVTISKVSSTGICANVTHIDVYLKGK